MYFKNNLVKVLLTLWSIPGALIAQSFGPNVQPYVSIDTPVFAIRNIGVIDGTGGPFQTGQTLVVSNGRITQFGATDRIEIPPEAMILQGSGKTVLPGFVMMHEHMYYPAISPEFYHLNQMDYSFPKLYLAGGATTIRTAGSIEPSSDLNLKRWINEGIALGPKMDVTGPYINRAGFPITQIRAIESAQEAREMVNYWADRGVTSFKVYENLHKAELAAVVEEAHK